MTEHKYSHMLWDWQNWKRFADKFNLQDDMYIIEQTIK